LGDERFDDEGRVIRLDIANLRYSTFTFQMVKEDWIAWRLTGILCEVIGYLQLTYIKPEADHHYRGF
jgi:hypothetical protein